LPLGFSSRRSPSTQRFITREPTLPKPRRLDNPTQYLRENRLPRCLRAFPARRPTLRLAPLEGRAPHAHNEGIGFARACPPWALGSSITPGDHDTPRFAAGLTTRTHRVRPSEETAFRVIPGFSQLGHLALDGPPRGGAGSGRPQCKSRAPRHFRRISGLVSTFFAGAPEPGTIVNPEHI